MQVKFLIGFTVIDNRSTSIHWWQCGGEVRVEDFICPVKGTLIKVMGEDRTVENVTIEYSTVLRVEKISIGFTDKGGPREKKEYEHISQSLRERGWSNEKETIR